jgi:hypothetical protein
VYVILRGNKHIKSTVLRDLSPRTRPSDSRLSVKLMPTFAHKGCHVVSMTNPCGLIFGFLTRSRYFFFQVAQLYSRGWVDTVPDPLLLRKSGSTGNRTRTSRYLARNSDYYTTTRPKRRSNFFYIYKFSSNLTGSTIHLRSAVRNSDH